MMLHEILTILKKDSPDQEKAQEILSAVTRKAEPTAWLNPQLRATFLATDDNDEAANEAFRAGKLEPLFVCAPVRMHDLEDLLLWVLYHHQGGSSHIGQPIRKALGIEPYADLTNAQIERGKFAAQSTFTNS